MRQFLRKAAWGLADSIDRRISSHFRLVPRQLVHELPEQDALRNFIAYFDVDCIFDVGANRGQYGQRLRDAIGFDGHIVSFEPIPECAAHIRSIASHDPKWHVEEVALADSEGEASFNIMAETEFSSLSRPTDRAVDLKQAGNSVSKVVKVRMDTLVRQFDAYRSKTGFLRPFLKMDTQGNDLRVARGAGERLSSFVGLQSELSIMPIYDGMPSYTESIAFYEQQGFKLSALVPNNPGHFPNLVEIDCIMYNLARLSETRRTASGSKA